MLSVLIAFHIIKSFAYNKPHWGGGIAELVARTPTVLKVRDSNQDTD
jgi:hypothetical protein